MGQIQKKVEEMKVNRLSGGPYHADPINGLTKSETDDVAGREQEPGKENGAADQPPSTPTKGEQAKPQTAESEAQDIDTDDEEASAPVDTEMAVAARRRANGLKRIALLDRPIEIDPQEYNRKRKASEKLAGSPFSSPAAKRAKDDAESRTKSPTIAEEKSEPNSKPPSTPQGPFSSPQGTFSSGLVGFLNLCRIVPDVDSRRDSQHLHLRHRRLPRSSHLPTRHLGEELALVPFLVVVGLPLNLNPHSQHSLLLPHRSNRGQPVYLRLHLLTRIHLRV